MGVQVSRTWEKILKFAVVRDEFYEIINSGLALEKLTFDQIFCT